MKILLAFSSFLLISAVFYISANLYVYREFLQSLGLMLIWIVSLSFWIKNFVLVLQKAK